MPPYFVLPPMPKLTGGAKRILITGGAGTALLLLSCSQFPNLCTRPHLSRAWCGAVRCGVLLVFLFRVTCLVLFRTRPEGFIGSHLTDRLLSEGHVVIVLDNFFTGNRENYQHHLTNPRFHVLDYDVVDPIYLDADQIYHLACPASPYAPHSHTPPSGPAVHVVAKWPSPLVLSRRLTFRDCGGGVTWVGCTASAVCTTSTTPSRR